MQFRVGPWLVRPEMDNIVRDGESCHVSPKAMDVLTFLARRPGQVVGKDAILQEVWRGTFVSDDSLTRSIGELRRAFHDDTREAKVIGTIAKRGYVLLAPVSWDPDIASPTPGASGELPPAAPVQREILETPPRTAEQLENGRTQLVPQYRPRRRWMWAGALVLLAAILLILSLKNWNAWLGGGAQPRILTIAVLPLTNLSADPEQEYFADGMTEELITELAQIRAWNVISRTSAMRYKGVKEPLRKIARELTADAIVEGTVLRSSGRVRITAQLIDAQTDRHLWSGSFERDLRDVLSLQREIAAMIAGNLKIAITPRVQARLKLTGRVVPEAYEAYLKGWYFFDRAQYAKAASYFEQATVADPSFALAYALLAESDGMSRVTRPDPLSARGRKAIEKARQLDDSLAEVHDAAGDDAFFANWNWEVGLAEYRQATELDPASVDAAWHYALSLQVLGQWEAAERELRRALRVDPVSPMLNAQLLAVFVDAHRYEPALEQFRKVIELNPDSRNAYADMATLYAAKGSNEQAAAAYIKAETLSGISAEAAESLATAAREGGFHGCLNQRIEQLQEEAKRGYVSPLAFAYTYARLGDKDQALHYLEEAYRQHMPALPWIHTRAIWDPLRSDPRFTDLLRRMRFPE